VPPLVVVGNGWQKFAAVGVGAPRQRKGWNGSEPRHWHARELARAENGGPRVPWRTTSELGMNIVFLTHYFPPEVNAPASRTYEHCREWVKRGHDVTVVTCAPNHPFGRVYDGYHNLPWQVESIDGIRVIRLWTFLTPNEGVCKRITNYASYMLVAALAAPFLPRPHVVISTSPQFFCGLAGYVVSRVHRAPWVLEIRDLWPDSITAVGALRNAWAIRLCERLEAWAYRKADKIVTVTDSFRTHIGERAAADKIIVVKNGVDLEQFGRLERDHSLARELGVEGRFTAAYFGTHGMAHGLDVVLRAAVLLRNDPRIVFLLVGDEPSVAGCKQCEGSSASRMS
jgi:Glycosyl transferase 4-like domain